MQPREIGFAALLLVAAAVIAAGVHIIHAPSGLIVGGVLLAGWSWLVLAEVR